MLSPTVTLRSSPMTIPHALEAPRWRIAAVTQVRSAVVPATDLALLGLGWAGNVLRKPLNKDEHEVRD